MDSATLFLPMMQISLFGFCYEISLLFLYKYTVFTVTQDDFF